jgi:hypothetical protein
LQWLAANIICSFGPRQLESSAPVRFVFWLAALDDFRNYLISAA